MEAFFKIRFALSSGWSQLVYLFVRSKYANYLAKLNLVRRSHIYLCWTERSKVGAAVK